MKFQVTALLFAISALAGASAWPQRFELDRRIPIGGEGGWDYAAIDGSTHRLFVTHGTKVEVLDLGTGKVVGTIPDTHGVHGVAFAPDRGFTSDGRDSTVTVFDRKTLAVLTRIRVPARNPDAIAYDPASHRVFTFNGGSGNATAIDAERDSVVGTIPLDGRPEFAAADGQGRMYVNLEDSSAVLAFDTRALKVLSRWPVAPGEEPTGLAMDRKHRRVFAGCANQQLIVLDADNGRVVSALPIGRGVDAVAFDESRQLVFTSNGEGTLTVIHQDAPDRYTVLESVTTQRGARTLALDEATGSVFLPTAEFGPPPEPTADRPHPRPSIVPGSFSILELRDSVSRPTGRVTR